MKANEAPDKIYVHVRANKELGTTWHGKKITNSDIEYVRKDAFVDKACVFMRERLIFDDNTLYTDGEVTLKDKVIENFINYMKGE